MIPQKIHITYINESLPGLYQNNLQKWKEICSSWEFHFYSDEKVYALFNAYFPHYSTEIKKVPYGAMLADFFRYAVLYIHGGLYTDIDTVPLKKIPEKWLLFDSVIGHEVQTTQHQFFCQWTLLSKPRNPLFKEALDKAFETLRKFDYCIDTEDKVLATAGPIFFTSIVKKYQQDPHILILDADYFARNPELGLPFTKRSVIYHQFHGTWKLNLLLPHIQLNTKP